MVGGVLLIVCCGWLCFVVLGVVVDLLIVLRIYFNVMVCVLAVG